MPRIVDHEEYLTTQEAIDALGASRKRFYENVKPTLTPHTFDGKKTPWYRKNDILTIMGEKPVPDGSIVISGILPDWTRYVRSLGYQADTKTRTIEANVLLPDDLAMMFDVPADRCFMKRPRITFVHQVPICMWDTYYPMELVEGDILAQVKQGSLDDIVKAIKDEHHVVVGKAKDKYAARLATQEEQELLQLKDVDPVLILYRVNYTRDKKTLVFVQRMTLLSSFAPEHEYDVHNWDE